MGDRFFTMRERNKKNNLILECHRSVVDAMAIFVCQAHELFRELGPRVESSGSVCTLRKEYTLFISIKPCRTRAKSRRRREAL